ncbi:hypothetical protein [Flyfo microvirus Tbat2_163]|nr:hypothetical protein [Flyfo microvirus Tbat2_163]
MFIHKYNFVPPVGEQNSGEIITDSTGHMSISAQVQSFLVAGQMLSTARDLYYEDDTGNDDLELDPTTRKSFTGADADLLLKVIEDNKRNNKRFQQVSDEASKARLAQSNLIDLIAEEVASRSISDSPSDSSEPERNASS